MPFEKALRAGGIKGHDYVSPYVDDLGSVVDLEAMAAAGLGSASTPSAARRSLSGSRSPSATA